jgi:hypothetical protein
LLAPGFRPGAGHTLTHNWSRAKKAPRATSPDDTVCSAADGTNQSRARGLTNSLAPNGSKTVDGNFGKISKGWFLTPKKIRAYTQ